MKIGIIAIVVISTALVGCIPKIEVAAPKEPITINMNVKVDHEITIKADPDVERLINQRQAERTPTKMQAPK
ncbi:YnbE family lipoprotein [Rosenbergiella australiborealis]|uniref:YnbE family lipoprotein n=1 Tax=Rosenbergiella australiborealis TaxID=1544696 RepID=UPI001F4F0B45|nr:YnbE family lipoprotein [Rosenbergiella australiborealis]